MKTAVRFTLAFSMALAGCGYGPTDHYRKINAAFNTMAHKVEGSSEIVITENVSDGSVDLVIKRHEFINHQATTDPRTKGAEYCEEFSIIRAMPTPQGFFLIPYSKISEIDGVRTPMATSALIPDREPGTMLGIPDEFPDLSGLKEPYKLQRRNMVQCYFRPEGTVLK